MTEVDLEGRPAELSSQELPVPSGEAQQRDYASIQSVLDAYQNIISPLKSNCLGHLESFLNSLESDSRGSKILSVRLDPCEDKDTRRRIHELFRNCSFLPAMKTEVQSRLGKDSAVADGDKNAIVLSKGNGDRGIEPWPGGKSKKYLKFVIQKTNKESHALLSLMKRYLRVSDKCITVAGTKDKRGVTAQWATAYRVHPKRLLQIQNGLKDVYFGNFEYVADQLHLGDLSGNTFQVILRGVTVDESLVRHAVECARKSGFINYFGLQRFGTGVAATHKIGEMLIQGSWKAAVHAILTPSNSEDHLSDALARFQRGDDFEMCLKDIPNYLLEKRMLKCLSKGGDQRYLTALKEIPKSQKLMYIHAFQSYVWNKAASKRVKLYGVEHVVAGDLVIPASCKQSRADHVESKKRKRNDLETECFDSVEPHVVTEDECIKNKYSIDDVVLPLPGNSVVVPQNALSDFYQQLLKENGLYIDNQLHGVREFSFHDYSGGYRSFIHKPKDMSVSFHHYDSVNDPIPNKNSSGKFLAAELKFTLPPSTYATMVLREITKMQTDAASLKSATHPDISEEVKVAPP